MKLPPEQNDPITICYDGSGVWHHAFIFGLHRCCSFQTRLRSDVGRGTWRLCYRSPSFPNSPSSLLVILRMFMTYDFAQALIPRWGHIVGSYLALAWTRVRWSCHFFWRRSFLIGPKQTSSRKALMWWFTAKVAVALIRNRTLVVLCDCARLCTFDLATCCQFVLRRAVIPVHHGCMLLLARLGSWMWLKVT